MAYPYQIAASPAAAPDFFNGRPIHRSATVVYKHLINTTADTLEVWKSTDAGVTWAEQDAANSKAILNDILPLDYFDDGTRFRFMTQNGAAAARLYTFNTSTDLWESDITGGPVAAAAAGGSTINPWKQYGIEVRSNGDIVVFYSVSGLFSNSEIWAQVYSGGSWGAAFEVLVQDVTEVGYLAPYTFIGSDIDDDDQIHVYGWTPNGLCYIRVNANNTTANYYRFDLDVMEGAYIGGRAGIYGEVRVVELNQVRYAALPHAYQQVRDNDTFLSPAVLLVPTDSSPKHYRIEIIPEFMNNLNFSGVSWLSVNVAYDATTEALWLIWTRDDSTAFDYLFDIRAAHTLGGEWSASVLVFSAPTDDVLNTTESTVENNVLRMLFQTSDAGTYISPHYWQSTLTVTAPSPCTTDFSGQDLSGYNFSGANFTGANLTGATGLPATDCTPVVPVGADPPMPPVYPYVPSSGSVYARENLTANLKMIRGDTFVFKFAVVLNGVVVNITGNDFIMTCRYRPTETVVFTRTSDPADGIVLSDPTVGECTVTIDPEHTDFLNNSVLRFPYDVEMTDGSGNVSTVLYGTLTIYPDITYVDA